MLYNIGDFKDEFVVRMNIATTASGFYTETMLNDWIKQSHRAASAYKKWPFTEGRVSTTYTTANEEWSFEGYQADSFRFMQIGGKRLLKLNFQDYQIFREEEPSAADRVYTDFARLVFINPKVDISGTLTAWGQYQPAELDTTDHTALTIFSGAEEDGNQAMMELMMGYARQREKKFIQAAAHFKRATEMLDAIWKRSEDEQAMYQTHPDRGGMFKRVNVLYGALSDELIKRDQFYI